MRVENKYINAIYLIMEYHALEELEVRNVRKSFDSYKKFLSLHKNYKELYTKEILSMYDEVPLLSKANLSQIGLICRLQLREDIGCRLFYPRRLKISIGYDFLMGIKSSRPLEPIIPQILDLGLSVDKETPKGVVVWEPHKRSARLWATWGSDGKLIFPTQKTQ